MANIKLKLRKVVLNNETVEEFCERKVKEVDKSIRKKGIEKSGYDDFIEAFNDLCEGYLLLKGNLFKIIESKENTDLVMIANRVDGTIDVVITHHHATYWRDNIRPEDIEKLVN